MSQKKNSEKMNATEKFYLPVDGIFDMFSSLTSPPAATSPGVQRAVATQQQQQLPKAANLSKTGLGIIRMVKESWKQPVAHRSSSSSTARQLSTERQAKRSVDLLELGLAKPKNCHRIVVLGAARVGKTNILQRFLGNEFDESYAPTSEDFHRKLFHIGGEAYQVDLLDAASERNFPAKRRLSILTGESEERELESSRVELHQSLRESNLYCSGMKCFSNRRNSNRR